MKGRLFKKILPEGWYIAYDIDSFSKSEIRLHKDDAIRMIDEVHNGREVDFEKVISALDFEQYARLIPYISDNFQIGPDGAYEHTEEDEKDWDVTLMDGLEDEDDPIPPTEELIESHKRYVEMMKYIHEEQWETLYNSYKGVSDLHDFFNWMKDNYYPPTKKPLI